MNSFPLNQDIVRTQPVQPAGKKDTDQIPTPQEIQAVWDAAGANDTATFTRLVRNAEQRVQPRRQPTVNGMPQLLAQPTLPSGFAGPARMGGPVMPIRGRRDQGRPGPMLQRPAVPERLDRFELFLGNFIAAIGEGMSIRQAARASLQNFSSQQQQTTPAAEYSALKDRTLQGRIRTRPSPKQVAERYKPKIQKQGRVRDKAAQRPAIAQAADAEQRNRPASPGKGRNGQRSVLPGSKRSSPHEIAQRYKRSTRRRTTK